MQKSCRAMLSNIDNVLSEFSIFTVEQRVVIIHCQLFSMISKRLNVSVPLVNSGNSKNRRLSVMCARSKYVIILYYSILGAYPSKVHMNKSYVHRFIPFTYRNSLSLKRSHYFMANGHRQKTEENCSRSSSWFYLVSVSYVQ